MARLSNDTIDRLKGLDIRDVADRLGVELPRGNGNARCFNQEAHAHGDRHGSLGFNAKTNTFKCFACGISGDPIALVQAYNKVEFRYKKEKPKKPRKKANGWEKQARKAERQLKANQRKFGVL